MKTVEYTEGARALANFERGMKALFRLTSTLPHPSRFSTGRGFCNLVERVLRRIENFTCSVERTGTEARRPLQRSIVPSASQSLPDLLCVQD